LRISVFSLYGYHIIVYIKDGYIIFPACTEIELLSLEFLSMDHSNQLVRWSNLLRIGPDRISVQWNRLITWPWPLATSYGLETIIEYNQSFKTRKIIRNIVILQYVRYIPVFGPILLPTSSLFKFWLQRKKKYSNTV